MYSVCLLVCPRFVIAAACLLMVGQLGGSASAEDLDGQGSSAEEVAQDNVAAGYVGAETPATPAAVYGQGVRETPWRSPADEQAGFHLPPGFEVQLFASEPMISKPLNMAWDYRGRLWVTTTVEYPYPAADNDVAHDRIVILEDTNADGQADKSTTFADGLNIPMGLLPMPDGVICFSIPNLWYLRDTNGDDRVDERQLLYGPFDTSRDTHGMINALRRGEDGWIYACHGFNNQSDVSGADGSRVKMNSGNVFRFKPNGERIELVTQGQVNPFGLTVDEWGNFYSADCHSKPLTALLPGACYPSFGRPHDGLGFAPEMMNHLHDSTAISGVAYYQAEAFPLAYRRRFYSGNVMTSRLNCNAIAWRGGTAQAVQLPDFMTSDDPWFRPVDVQLAPDGSLMVADFYNKIIGHYEVPLTHPGRDRDSGRIWRIVHSRGRAQAAELAATSSPVAAGSPDPLALDSPNVTQRRLAVEQLLASNSPAEIGRRFEAVLLAPATPPLLAISGLEALARSGQLTDAILAQAIESKQPMLACRGLRLAAAREDVGGVYLAAARMQLDSETPQVVLAAMGCLKAHGDHRDVIRLLELATARREQDKALTHAARIAARDLLRHEPILKQVDQLLLSGTSGTDEQAGNGPIEAYVGVLPGLDSPAAAGRLLAYALGDADGKLLDDALGLAMKYPAHVRLADVLQGIQQLSPNDLDIQTQQLGQLLTQIQQWNLAQPDDALGLEAMLPLMEFHSRLVRETAAAIKSPNAAGGCLQWFTQEALEWPVEPRTTGENQSLPMWSSHPKGERYTGVLASERFACPEQIAFWLAGHNGYPAEPDHQKNLVRLVAANSGEVLRVAFPPRNDVAARIAWSLEEVAGTRVRVELVDADSGDAYAWLAVGGFTLEQLNHHPRQALIGRLAALLTMKLPTQLADRELLAGLNLSDRQQAKIIEARLQGQGHRTASQLASLALRLDVCQELTLDDLVMGTDTQRLQDVARRLCSFASIQQQRGLVGSLLGSADGCQLVAWLLQQGTIGASAVRGDEAILPRSLSPETRKVLVDALSAASDAVDSEKVVAARLASLAWNTADPQDGRQLFTQHCANCHQLGGQGKLIGPQLDGAVVRSRQRLAEDILTPNKNVDLAFRTTSVLLENDDVVTGLIVNEDDQALQFALADGKQVLVAKTQVAIRRDSTQSLMPANFGELLSDEQLAGLLRYLVEFTPAK